MSGLRERMNRLLRSEAGTASADEQATAAHEKPEKDDAVAVDPFAELWRQMQVSEATNEYGSFLRREKRYPLQYKHGHHCLAKLAEAVHAMGAFYPDADLGEVTAESLLFLDLETTGLGAGAGNVPFMVGLAYVSQGEFIVHQSLIRHPAEERAMLAELRGLLQQFRYLVTYNGKTFDWPVLAGRYIMNGLGRIELPLLHLDFLHPSRSIWRNTLSSCKLSHIEEERLGIKREHDVPGAMAPMIYFQFLADANPLPLEGVFRHNEFDMLTLASLTVRFGCLLDGRLGVEHPFPEEPEELLRTGMWLERMNREQHAEHLFTRLLEAAPLQASWSLPLAARDKKVGNWQRAVLLWQKTALQQEGTAIPDYTAHIELAMYYEHRAKDIVAALHYAELAFELAQRRSRLQRIDAKQRQELEKLTLRVGRLRRRDSKGRRLSL